VPPGKITNSMIEAHKAGLKEITREELEAHYLAQALTNYILILSPKRIILGGGVMKQSSLYPMIREKTYELLNNYIPLPPAEEYIVPPGLGDDQGILGAIQLACLAN